MEISSSVQWMLAAVIFFYLIVMYAIGFIAQSKVETAEDFLVAGRQLPLSLAWMTLLATWFGAGTLLAAADEVRQEGLQAGALDPFGAGCCLLLAGLFVAGPIWRMQILTVPDLFRQKFGPAAELIASLILVPSYFGWIAAQFTALANMLELFFGIPLSAGLVIVAVVGTGYTLMGGMWSVTLTDAVQITLVLLGLIILTIVILAELGNGSASSGMTKLWEETPPEMSVIIPYQDVAAFWGWLGLFLTGALGNLPGQDLMQRIFACKSDRVAIIACYIAGGMYLLFGLMPMLLGLTANLLFPEEVNTAVLPALAHAFLHPAVAIVFVVAVLSAVLSTIDSAILSPASVLSQNIGTRFLKMDLLKMNRYAVLLVAVCSLAMAFAGEDAYALLEEAYLLTMVGLFVPMMFGLYTKPRHRYAAVASMLTGIILWGLHFLMGWETFLTPLEPLAIWPVPLSLTITGLALIVYLICEPPWQMEWVKP